jgi:hypothetical protein
MDIVDDLNLALGEQAVAHDLSPAAWWEVAHRALDEIKRLRAELENAKRVVGAVTSGPSFADIKQNKNVLILDGSRGE